MSLVARTDTAEQRSAIYKALVRRNRLVRMLRIGLPAIGAVVFAGLILQIYIGTLIPDFGFANITIDRDNLIVEAPVYSGVGGDGSVFSVKAVSARTSLGNSDLIELTDATFALEQPGGSMFEAKGAKAQLHVADELVVVDGIAYVEGSNNLSGTVVDAQIDVGAETMHSTGPVDLTLQDANVKSATMSYDSATGRWTFHDSTLLLNQTPGESTDGLRPSVEISPVREDAP